MQLRAVLQLVALAASLLGTGCRFTGQGRNVDGVRQYQMGRYQEAIQKFQRALVVNPQNSDAYYNLAATYYAMGKQTGDRALLQQAEGLYHQCLDLQPNHVACHRGLAALLVDTDRPDAAFTLMKRWVVQEPTFAESRIELARLYEEFGDRDAAAQNLTEALNLDAKNGRAWTALGRVREQQGQLAQALSNYQQAYNLNRNQQGLAERIASLNRGVSASLPQFSGGTQMVTAPSNSTTR